MDCIFCKIIKKEIPAEMVYENEKVVAFLDANPTNKGHILVVPKKHVETILEASDSVIQEVFAVIKKVAKVQKKVLKSEGTNIGINNGAAAGQVIFHAHVHVIPRFQEDGLKHWPAGHYEAGEAVKIANSLKAFL